MPSNTPGYDYRGGYQSPIVNKHVSSAIAPMAGTDAFGNPAPPGYMAGQPFPVNYMPMPGQQAYNPHMQPGHVMGQYYSPQQQQQQQHMWPPSPSNEIFGMAPGQTDRQPLVGEMDVHSAHSSSPHPEHGVVGGMDGYLGDRHASAATMEKEANLHQRSP